MSSYFEFDLESVLTSGDHDAARSDFRLFHALFRRVAFERRTDEPRCGRYRTRDLIVAYANAYAAGDMDAWVKGEAPEFAPLRLAGSAGGATLYPRQQMTTARIPQTDSIDELARFWDTHDLTEFADELEDVGERVFVRSTVVNSLDVGQTGVSTRWPC